MGALQCFSPALRDSKLNFGCVPNEKREMQTRRGSRSRPLRGRHGRVEGRLLARSNVAAALLTLVCRVGPPARVLPGWHMPSYRQLRLGSATSDRLEY